MLEATGLRRPNLGPIDLRIAAGECVALRGPSGAGKSLLLRALSDLDPTEGEVRLDGIQRTEIEAPDWRRRVGYVPAEPGWWADLAAEHFSDLERATLLCERLGIAAEMLSKPIARLSTGERQRMALVRALCQDPEVLLLDEPTGPLDGESTTLVEALITELREAGLTVLWVTHDPAQAERVASRVLRIADGLLSEVAP